MEITTFAEFQDLAFKCQKCELRGQPQVSQVVIGDGPPHARFMVIGEAPGFNEDKDGKPFVGVSGALLKHVLSRAGFDSKDIYYANIVKCRPPENRDPSPEEIENCIPWLEKQISLIKPELIITVGKFSSQFILSKYHDSSFGDKKITMTNMRGRLHACKDFLCLPTWHPAYILRNQSKKKEFWEDLLVASSNFSLEVKTNPMEAK